MRFGKIIKFLATNPNYEFAKNIQQSMLLFLSSTEEMNQLSEKGDFKVQTTLEKENNQQR